MDTLTKAGATELAKKCTAWWHDRGHTNVKFSVEPLNREDGQGQQLFAVQSNLVAGLPPGVTSIARPAADPSGARNLAKIQKGARPARAAAEIAVEQAA